MPTTYGWSNYKGKRVFKRARSGSSSYSRPVVLSQSTQGSQAMAVVAVPRNRFRNIDTKVFRTRRSLVQNIGINQSLGWAAGGGTGSRDLTIQTALTSACFWLGGSIIFNPVLPSVGEFTALFDHYRIDRINVQAIFSNNESGVNAPNTVLPILHIMTDYNSVNSQTQAEYLQHPEMRSYQLGTGKTIRWSYVPRSRGDLLTDGEIVSTSANSKARQWIDTSSPQVSHLGLRMYLDTIGKTNDVDIGNVQIIVTYELSFRSVK